MNKLGQKVGMPKMRVMTDFCAGYHDLVEYGRREIYKIDG